MTRRLILAAAVLGIAGGAIAAVTVPRHRTASASNPATAGPRQAPIRVGKPARLPGSTVSIRPAGPVRAATLADPAGGPAFVMRWFSGKRVVPKPIRRPGVNPVVGHGWCVELARRYHGRLGWIDSQRTFHAGHELPGIQPIDCGSRLPDMRRTPLYDVITTITDPSQPTARILATIAYGIAGPAARSVTIQTPGRTLRPHLSRQGSFLVALPRGTSPADVGFTFAYTSGEPISADGYGVQSAERPPGFPRRPPIAPGARPIADALAPDPLGGVPYAVPAVRTSDGGWCADTAARLVDGRVGEIEGRLGTFTEFSARRVALQCFGAGKLTANNPLSFGYGGGSEDYDAIETGRVQRRAQRGIFQIAGIAADDVRQIVIATPRDVRTVIPGPRAHTFLAVYDGEFPTGSITLTSIMRDGHRHVDRIDDPGP
jgi:hypothetical protein